MSSGEPAPAAADRSGEGLARRRGRARLAALAALVATNVCDAGFLILDPRNPVFEPWLAGLFFAGGAAYAAALVLVLQSRASGFVLCAILAPPSAFVVALDNLNTSTGGPTPTVFALNLVFFLAQPVLAAASVYWLKRSLS